METKAAAHTLEMHYPDDDPIWVEDDSPKRCKHSTHSKQCNFSKFEGQEYCKYHVHIYNYNFRKQAKLKKYRLFAHHCRVEEFVVNPQLKDLCEEIGILNMTLETLLNQCHTPWDIITNQTRIESLVERIAKTTTINIRLQTLLGKTMDQTTIGSLMDAVSKAIIDENLTDEQLKRIGQKVGFALAESEKQAQTTALLEYKP